MDVIGLAKEERSFVTGKEIRKMKAVKSEDRVYLPGRKDAVFLSAWPGAVALLQQVRDEAHRFAVSYHHRLKQKEDFRSVLDAIPDIGIRRRKSLLQTFGSVHQIQNASPEDLQKVDGIGEELAKKIHSHFQNKT